MLESAKTIARKLRVYQYAHSAYRRLQREMPRHELQDLQTAGGYKLRRLGTEYGGWTFVNDPHLWGSTIVSAGLGEDASFDIEFAKKYNAKVIIVDPTPRAISHYTDIVAHLGNGSTREYAHGGKQPIDAYDLRGLNSTQLVLVTKALWETATTLKFFEPRNPKHVSYSITNFQHKGSQNTPYIEVETVTLKELLNGLGLEAAKVQLIKLDIEGAQMEVISEFLDAGLQPNQILVEFDELTMPSEEAFDRVDSIHSKLTEHGYECIDTDGRANFLYVRPNQVKMAPMD